MFKQAYKELLIFIISLFGYLGSFLIVYGLFVLATNYQCLCLEAWAIKISTYATLFSAIICAVSIYCPDNKRPPIPFSKIFAAPFVILSALFTIILKFFFKVEVSPLMINGFALVAMSGVLFRLLSR